MPGKSKSGKSKKSKVVYQEFGSNSGADPLARAEPDLPPQKQDLRIQATRAGRKGKTVTVISGLQHNQDSLTKLLKKLKAQCGTGGTLRDGTIEIQGEHKQKLLDILVKLGYKAKISGG